jgi:glyoxylase-like metal-dependent hydrolase (beta-lactamase superfamily II)
VHHVSYFDQQTGIAFTGDTTGMRPSNRPCVIPVTPPPDIDLEAWQASLAAIAERRPARLFVTHFGPADNLDWHLEDMRERLARWGEQVAASLRAGQPDADAAREFSRQTLAELTTKLPAEQFGSMARPEALEGNWYGLARYWRKRGGP